MRADGSDHPTSSDFPLRDALRPSGPARFAMHVEHRPEALVVHVDGELDVLTAGSFGAELDGVIRSGVAELVLDLRSVRFIDSTGLQILLSTRRRLVNDSRTLSVLCAEGPVSRLFELTRLTETLRVTKVSPE